MGKNTFVATLQSSGQSKSYSINILKPEIIKGWWTSDKKGKNILKKSKLGQTVYFHVETKGIANGQKITLKLFEQDKNIFMIDWIDPDDSKFAEEEVIKNGTVKNNITTIKLALQESWETMIKDDSNNAFSLDQNLELYWEVTYGKRKKEIPIDDKDYLRVGHSERTLYFKTPIESSNLPEFVAYDGSPMFLMQFAKDFSLGELKEKAIKAGNNLIDETISNIAFAKLEKGSLTTNTGKKYTKNTQIYTKDIYTNEGELLKDVKTRKNIGYNHGKGIVTTKGISQYDYFSKTGKRVKILGFLKSLGSAFDIFDLVKFTMNDLDTSEPLSLNLGPLTPLFDLLGVLVQQQKAETDMWLEEIVQQEVNDAKLRGLEVTRKTINSWNHNEEYNWRLMSISNKTANQLLQGKFETFEEFYSYNEEYLDYDDNITVLYREIYNENKEQTVYIIETIFIDE